MINLIIADDHQLFIDGIRSILNQEVGIEIVDEANNGLDLLKKLEDKPLVDVVLTDIRMPVVDGITAAKLIRKQYPSLRILAVSMYDQPADVLEMMEAGAQGYVTKNVDKKELVEAIHTLMNGGRYISKNLPEDARAWLSKEPDGDKIPLTRREKEILGLIARGRTSLQIADQLKLSKHTVDTHRKNIHKKLGIKSNTGLVSYALKHL